MFGKFLCIMVRIRVSDRDIVNGMVSIRVDKISSLYTRKLLKQRRTPLHNRNVSLLYMSISLDDRYFLPNTHKDTF